MKKLIALTLAILTVVSMVACSKDEKEAAPVADNEAVVAYVEANSDMLLSSLEASLATAAGMTCTSSIDVVGSGIDVRINVNELDNLTSMQKEKIQETYDSMGTYLDSILTIAQREIPELESLTIYYCEKDGDEIAKLVID